MLPTTATTPAATVGHHCSRAKNIVTRSRSRRPSRQSFLADAPIASARLPNTMKQARAPATLGKVTLELPYEGASPAPLVPSSRPRAVPRLPQPKPAERAGHYQRGDACNPRGARYSPSRSKLVIRPRPNKTGDAHENGLYRDDRSPSDPYLVPAYGAPRPVTMDDRRADHLSD